MSRSFLLPVSSALLLLPGLLLAKLPPPPPGQELSRETLILRIEGDLDSCTVAAVHRKAFPFLQPRTSPRPPAWIEVRDSEGRLLFRRDLDLSPFNLDRGANKGKTLVEGCLVKEGRISLLVKIPDLFPWASEIRLLRREGGGIRLLGKVSGEEIRKLLSSGLPGPMMAPVVKTHLNNGPVKNRYDIVLIGDGYQSTEQATFYTDVTRWMNDLFARQPFKDYKKFFNVHSVFRASKESGADHPDRTPPIYKDTVYDASYNMGGIPRCLYIKNGTLAKADAALAPDVEGRIVVFVNDSRYGGCAGTFAVSYNGSSGPRVQSHEFGHSFGGVADEYDYGRSGTYTGPEPGAANITKDRTGKAKWPLWLGFNGVSAFEGAGYYRYGLFRPKISCLMRSLGSPLCEVCVEQLLKRGYDTVTSIEAPTPPTTKEITLLHPGTQTVSFTNIVPGTSAIKWNVDGKVVQTGGTSFQLSSSAIGLGGHLLKLEVADKTTMVRKDLAQRLVSTATWTVKVVDSQAPDLKFTAFTAPKSVNAGAKVQLSLTVQNAGKTSAGAFDVELFIGPGPVVGTSDTYLGSYPVSSLASNLTQTLKPTIPIPLFLSGKNLTLLGWIDRANKIKEFLEDNNQASAPMQVLAPPGCPVGLEYIDYLNFPHDQSRISISSGGVSTLQLTAPCHAAHHVLVLWTTKGTSPGIQLPGGHHLPLNYDPVFTTFGIANLNNGPFYNFFTKLDASGKAIPLVYLPGGFKIAPFKSNFAAILISPDFTKFTGASGAVGMDFVQ